MVMGSLPTRHARYRPRHTAVVIAAGATDEPELRLSWREFNAYVNRWANALTSLGIRRGDRVATQQMDLAHVGDVEEARTLPHGGVLLEDR